MNPILILQLKRLLASLTILLHLLASHSSGPQFGAATVTAGNSYPTSTYSFSDNDIINAGDFNKITNWVGTRNSTDTVSLSYAAFNPNLASSTGGPLTIANGGTATTSYTYGVVIGSSTQALSTIAPTAATTTFVGSIGGATWAATQIVAGTSTAITTSSNSLIINSTAILQSFISQTSTPSDGTAITFTADKSLATSTFTLANAGRVLIMVAGSGNNGTAADGCQFTAFLDNVDLDGTTNGFSSFIDTAGSQNHSLGFTVITSSTLSAATHTVNLHGKNITGGTCSARFQMSLEYMGI